MCNWTWIDVDANDTNASSSLGWTEIWHNIVDTSKQTAAATKYGDDEAAVSHDMWKITDCTR